MANLNKIMLIGHLTRDPEEVSFRNGGKVAKFGFAVNNRKKNGQTGEWENDPVFLDCEAYNRGESGTLADTVMRLLKKSSHVFIEGHLQMDSWDDKASGQKRTKLKVVVDVMQVLPKGPAFGEGGGEGEEGGESRSSRPAARAGAGASRGSNGPAKKPARMTQQYDEAVEDSESESGEGDIPF